MFKQKAILEFKPEVQDLFVRKTNDQLSFDTFFNSLNLYLIKKYTDGKRLSIFIDSNDVPVKVFYSSEKERRELFSSEHSVKSIEIDLTNLPESGIVYPVFYGDCKLKSLSYEVDAPNREMTTSVIFTTYNRQEFLIPNLYKLNTCENITNVIIVDNAKNVTLPNDLSSDKFIVIPNDNLGGTGGFTRGMIKAKSIGSSHMFIMDDDITLIPEVVDKALSLISCLKEECKDNWLGFSMLPLSRPTYQFELGTMWNGVRMVINHHNIDVSKLENIHKNQVNSKFNYSAWWSLIMPTTVIEKYGYPFPFFIKFDDIEYGLRREKEEIILTNGFAVWHEDFDKKYNPYLEYYLYRNALVTNLYHHKHDLSVSLMRYVAKNAKCLLKRRFIEMKLLNIAIDNFLEGPEFFENLDIEKKNTEIRTIAKEKVGILKGFFVNPFIACFYFYKLLFKYSKAKKQYIAGRALLTSEAYWNKVFNHE